MSYRVHPLWWPALVPLSPALAVVLARKSRAFRRGTVRAAEENAQRIGRAKPLDLAELESCKLTVVVEEKTTDGFLGDAAVSYLLNTNNGTVLFDVGHGPSNPVLAHNWKKLAARMDDVDAMVLSHLHLDHMGGLKAQKRRQVVIPAELEARRELTCYAPEPCTSPFFRVEQVSEPTLLPAGLATTGPLSRMLFFFGYSQEQSVIANLKGHGLIVVIGCGHPSVPVILSMVQKLSDAPLHAVVGGLHFPITASRAPKAGIHLQRIFGTGKTWHAPPNDSDLDATVEALQRAAPKRLLLSAHDSCDHALQRLERELDADVEVLSAGQTYDLAKGKETEQAAKSTSVGPQPAAQEVAG